MNTTPDLTFRWTRTRSARRGIGFLLAVVVLVAVGAGISSAAAGPAGPAGPSSSGAEGGPTVTFAITPAPRQLAFDSALTKVVSRYLTAGSWAMVATVNISPFVIRADQMRTTQCELHNPSTGVIGGAKDRRLIPNAQQVQVSLSMNGGTVVGAGGGELSLWCSAQGGARVDHAQIMITRIGGFA